MVHVLVTQRDAVLAHAGDPVETVNSTLMIAVALGAVIVVIGALLVRWYREKRGLGAHKQEVITYVRDNLLEDVPPSTIETELLNSGWPPETVRDAFRFLALKERALTKLLPDSRSFSSPAMFLRVGLALTFFLHAFIAYSNPKEFDALLDASLLWRWEEYTPLMIQIAGASDLAISIFLLFNIFPRLLGWWATAWLAGVVAIVLSNQNGINLAILQEALDHAAPLGIALWLAAAPSRSI